MTSLAKFLLQVLLCASVLSSCVVFIFPRLVVTALHDDSVCDFARVFNVYIDPGTQYANTVLSVRAGGAEGQAAGEAGEQTTCLEYHISTHHHFLCVYLSPFSERL